jgi:hypothetical protein
MSSAALAGSAAAETISAPNTHAARLFCMIFHPLFVAVGPHRGLIGAPAGERGACPERIVTASPGLSAGPAPKVMAAPLQGEGGRRRLDLGIGRWINSVSAFGGRLQ